MVDASKNNQHELLFNNKSGNISINLFTGRLLLEQPDLILGENSYQICINHVYNSHNRELEYYCGKGWKLNIQQYIFEEPGSEIQDGKVSSLVYIDEKGCSHRLVRMNAVEYYDESGLYLTYSSTARSLTDASGNRMIFDEQGRFVQLVSAVSDAVTKEIIYTSFADGISRISEMYDGRNIADGVVERKFTFTYNTAGLLSEIQILSLKNGVLSCIRKLHYYYNSESCLIRVGLSVDNEEKDISFYNYDQNYNLTYTIDVETKLGWEINNTSTASVSQISSLRKISATFDIIDGIGHIISEEEESYMLLVYKKEHTEVENEQGEVLFYHHDFGGEAAEVYETIETGDGKCNYAEVSPETSDGISLTPMAERGEESFNGRPVKIVASDGKCFGSAQLNKNIQKRVNAYNSFGRFVTLSMWIYTERQALTWRWATFKVNNSIMYLGMDGLRGHGWQFVSRDLWINADEQISTYSIELDMRALSGVVKVADPKMAINLSCGMLRGTDLTSQNSSSLHVSEITNMKVETDTDTFEIYFQPWNARYSRIDRGTDCFIGQDLTMTQRSMYKNASEPDKRFEVYWCGGRKRICGVKRVILYYELDSLYRKIVLLPNSAAEGRVYNWTYLADGTVREDWIHFYLDYVEKHVKAQRGNVFSSEWSRYTVGGLFTAGKDEYGVTTENAYDTYGNLLETKVYVPDNPDVLPMMRRYRYDARGEYLSGTTNECGKWITYETDENGGVYTSLTAKKEYKQCVIKDKYKNSKESVIESTAFQDSFLERSEKKYEYSDGKVLGIRKTSDLTSYFSWKFGYDAFGRISGIFYGENIAALTASHGIKGMRAGYFDEIKYNNTSVFEAEKTIVERTEWDMYGRVSEIRKNGLPCLENKYGVMDGYEIVAEWESRAPRYAKVVQTTNSGYTTKTEYETADGIDYFSVSTFEGDAYQQKYFTPYIPTTRDRVITEYQAFNNGNRYTFERREKYDDQHLLRPKLIEFAADTYDIYTYRYDELGRLISRNAYNMFAINYEYYEYTDETGRRVSTSLIKKETVTHFNRICRSAEYEYDDNGNIICITDESGKKTEYEYDRFGNLKIERNEKTNTREEIEYNSVGQRQNLRIQNKDTGEDKGYYQYYYGENGRLNTVAEYVAYNGPARSVKDIVYDGYGNPVDYLRSRKGTETAQQTMYWEGNRLTRTKINGKEVNYEYSAFGERTRKTVDGVVKTYHLKDGKIMAEDWGSGIKLENALLNNTIYGNRYEYDESGIIGITEMGSGGKTTYYLDKDAAGNVVGIYSDTGRKVYYRYDGWGNCKIIDDRGKEITDEEDIAQRNPFRWKGYYYDTETGLYWVGTRYYDPK